VRCVCVCMRRLLVERMRAIGLPPSWVCYHICSPPYVEAVPDAIALALSGFGRRCDVVCACVRACVCACLRCDWGCPKRYELLFPALCEVIRQIQARGIRGAALCNCLYRASITGFPEVKACIERLLFSLHQVRV
jgi:hypothetical protein